VAWRKNTGRRLSMTPRFVLDAWAMLALLQGEEPAARLAQAGSALPT
jgi:hypothetical protein